MGVVKKYRGTFAKCLEAYIADRLAGRDDIELDRIFITHSGVPDEIIALAKSCIAKYQTFDEICVTRAGCTVPLKIAEPSIRLTLLDSLGKRMRWLETVLPELGVDAEVVTGRAEEYVAGCREQYDAAVSRAVARLNVLAELCLPYVKVGGQFLAMKGAMAQEEADEAASAIRRLGGQIERIAEYPIGDAIHRVVIVRKIAPTPKSYPRPFAKIKKAPL